MKPWGWCHAVVALVLCLTISSCSVRRVNFNEPIAGDALTFIKTGETTLQEVVDRLGPPEEIVTTTGQFIAEFKWSTTRSSSLDFGHVFKIVSPVTPSMTLSGTGINVERFLVICDDRLIVRSYAFGKVDEHAFFEFWPF
ncbi:MAG: hypothetical protein FJ247_05740 [Nitrospira sp.]|nr:hypothetical protein [Nitrospira sp.]